MPYRDIHQSKPGHIKHSDVPGEVMTPEGLAPGELAINVADGKIYYRGPSGTFGVISGGVVTPVLSQWGSTGFYSVNSFDATPMTSNQTSGGLTAIGGTIENMLNLPGRRYAVRRTGDTTWYTGSWDSDGSDLVEFHETLRDSEGVNGGFMSCGLDDEGTAWFIEDNAGGQVKWVKTNGTAGTIQRIAYRSAASIGLHGRILPLGGGVVVAFLSAATSSNAGEQGLWWKCLGEMMKTTGHLRRAINLKHISAWTPSEAFNPIGLMHSGGSVYATIYSNGGRIAAPMPAEAEGSVGNATNGFGYAGMDGGNQSMSIYSGDIDEAFYDVHKDTGACYKVTTDGGLARTLFSTPAATSGLVDILMTPTGAPIAWGGGNYVCFGKDGSNAKGTVSPGNGMLLNPDGKFCLDNGDFFQPYTTPTWWSEGLSLSPIYNRFYQY